MANIDFTLVNRAWLQLLAKDFICERVYKQFGASHVLAEGPQPPLPMEALAYGSPSDGAVKVRHTHTHTSSYIRFFGVHAMVG